MLGGLEGSLRAKKLINLGSAQFSSSFTLISYQTCSPAAHPRPGVTGVHLPIPRSLQRVLTHF